MNLCIRAILHNVIVEKILKISVYSKNLFRTDYAYNTFFRDRRMKLYVSNKKETTRMFRSDFIEFFSRVHWTVPLWIFLPIIGIFLYYALNRFSLPAGGVAFALLAGLFTWTLTEYSLHRFLFHMNPKSEWGKKIHWTFHGVHHDYPSDPLRPGTRSPTDPSTRR